MSRKHLLLAYINSWASKEMIHIHPLLPFLFLWLVQRILAGPPISPFLCIPPRQWSLTNATEILTYLIIPGAAEQRNRCDTKASDWGWVDWLIDWSRVKLGFCCGCFSILISDEAGGNNVRHLSALFFCALRCVAFLLPGSEFLLGHIIMHVLLW